MSDDNDEIWVSHFYSRHRKGEPCNQCHAPLSTPDPSAGEWRVRRNDGARTEILDGDTIIFAAFISDEHAAQIVADHAAVGGLVEALTALRLAAQFALSTPGFIRGRDELRRAVEQAATATPPATGDEK